MKERKEILDSIDALLDRAYKLLGEERTRKQETAKEENQVENSKEKVNPMRLKFDVFSLGMTKEAFYDSAEKHEYKVLENGMLMGSLKSKLFSKPADNHKVFIRPYISDVTGNILALEISSESRSVDKIKLWMESWMGILSKKYKGFGSITGVETRIVKYFNLEKKLSTIKCGNYNAGWVLFYYKKTEYGPYEDIPTTEYGEIIECGGYVLLLIDKDEFQRIEDDRNKREAEDIDNLL